MMQQACRWARHILMPTVMLFDVIEPLIEGLHPNKVERAIGLYARRISGAQCNVALPSLTASRIWHASALEHTPQSSIVKPMQPHCKDMCFPPIKGSHAEAEGLTNRHRLQSGVQDE